MLKKQKLILVLILWSILSLVFCHVYQIYNLPCVFCVRKLLKDHLRRFHPDKANKSMEFFQALKRSYTQITISNVFGKKVDQNVRELIAFCNVSKATEKKSLPSTVGESLPIPAVKEIISPVMYKQSAPVLQAVLLSDTTVK